MNYKEADLPVILVETINPVSYTHLDVYKRQTMRSMLPVIKAGQSRALLLVTLYGCTDSSLYQRMAHELVDPWMEMCIRDSSNIMRPCPGLTGT